MSLFCRLGVHKWRTRFRRDLSTFARCSRCREPAIFRRWTAPIV